MRDAQQRGTLFRGASQPARRLTHAKPITFRGRGHPTERKTRSNTPVKQRRGAEAEDGLEAVQFSAQKCQNTRNESGDSGSVSGGAARELEQADAPSVRPGSTE